MQPYVIFNEEIVKELMELATVPLDELTRKEIDQVEKKYLYFLTALENGSLRCAYFYKNNWVVDERIKQLILFGFRFSDVILMEGGFLDKRLFPKRIFQKESEVRLVPCASGVRRGAFLGKGCVVMSPAFINVGAFVDEHTLIDSNALVGSCAQVGKRVHVSAGVQIGGVLEPIGALPVIVEDDVFIGGNSGVYEGVILKKGAVIGAGVVLTGSTPVYDLVHQRTLKATDEAPLTIPENAVVVAGTRALKQPFAVEQGLCVAAAMIIKYKDEKTKGKVLLEEALRA